MNKIKLLAAAAGLTTIALACVAQEEEEETPDVFTYATYFYCDGGPNSRVDEIVAKDTKRMDGFVEDGTISAWGWLAHHTGGQWQRVFYVQAGSIDALLDAYDKMDDDSEEAQADNEEFGRICPSHDDYIWQVENGSQTKGRGEVGFSVYLVCDAATEDEADDIVAEHVAPILNGMVEDGKLTSWGWSSHVVGGRFRKLQTFTAPDFKTLMAARAEAIEAIYGEDDEAGARLTEICGSHVDYMWNIVHETP